MKSLAVFPNGTLVTGASGFIGQHFCREMGDRNGGSPARAEASDVLDLAGLNRAAAGAQVQAVIHLASSGVVIAPTASCPLMFATAVEGTLNVMQAFQPRTMVFASTCSVYGESEDCGARPGTNRPNPAGLYGLSKVAGEMMVEQWAAETGNHGVVMRIGNVIGPGCGGLIPYLVRHAVANPDGNVPAKLRGAGRIVRDYVPVDHVVRLLIAAAERDWPQVGTRTFNVGTGRGMANSRVAGIVRQLLAEAGYGLRIEYSDTTARGEVWQSILDSRATTEEFGIEPPREAVVLDVIAASVQSHLLRLAPAAGRPEVSKR